MQALPISTSAGRRGRVLKLHRNDKTVEFQVSHDRCKSPMNPSIPETGTGHAIRYLPLGVAALSVPKPTHGGARNRSDRVSDALKPTQIVNLIAATAHAGAIGLPFTRMITIHWQSAGIALPGMAKATNRFTDLLTKALARHGSRTAWVWVHENGEGKGGHCHLLTHVPAELVRRVTNLQRGWIHSITGNPYRARVIRSDPIGGRLGLEVGNPDLHAVNLQAAFGYLCKGAPPAVLDANTIDRQHEPGGLIIGKRCGTSQNIAVKARQSPIIDLEKCR